MIELIRYEKIRSGEIFICTNLWRSTWFYSCRTQIIPERERENMSWGPFGLRFIISLALILCTFSHWFSSMHVFYCLSLSFFFFLKGRGKKKLSKGLFILILSFSERKKWSFELSKNFLEYLQSLSAMFPRDYLSYY